MKALEVFLAAMPVRKVCKDELLLQQDEPLRQTYVVKEGAVRCYDISLDGNQQLISLATEGEFFPVATPLDTDETAPFFYSAFMDSEVYVVNRRRLALFLKANPGTMLDLYTTMTKRLADLQYRVNAVAKPKAREKILHTLAFMADRFKTRRTNVGTPVEVALPLTHQDIADLVGLTRETTTATLKILREEGFVEYDRRHFLIRRDKIQEALW